MRLRQLATLALFVGLTGTLIAQTPDARPVRASMKWYDGPVFGITADSVEGSIPGPRKYNNAQISIDGFTILADEMTLDRNEIRLQGRVTLRPK